jgi:hypothetical protein
MNTQFNRTQAACDRLFAYIDNLLLHGKTKAEAIDHASHQFGVIRVEIQELVDDRALNRIGYLEEGL